MYQVCTKDEYTDTWHLEECEDLTGVKEAILAATKSGREIRISIPMEFSIDVKIQAEPSEKILTAKEKYRRGVEKPKEEAKHEATESGPEKDPGSGDQGNRPV